MYKSLKLLTLFQNSLQLPKCLEIRLDALKSTPLTEGGI